MSVTGSEASGPVKVGAPVLDVGAGISCAFGLLAAHLERLRTGVGRQVSSSLMEFALTSLGHAGGEHVRLRRGRRAARNALADVRPVRRLPHGRRMDRARGRGLGGPVDPLLQGPGRRRAPRRPAVRGQRVPRAAPRRADRRVRAGARASAERALAASCSRPRACRPRRCATSTQVFADAQTAALGAVQTLHHPDAGDYRVVGVPVRFDRAPFPYPSAAPDARRGHARGPDRPRAERGRGGRARRPAGWRSRRERAERWRTRCSDARSSSRRSRPRRASRATGRRSVRSWWDADGMRDVRVDDDRERVGPRARRRRGRRDPLRAPRHRVRSGPVRTRRARDGSRLRGPGVGDDAVGGRVALGGGGLLGRTRGAPVWLLASVGEEGLGNLCGVSAALDAPPDRRRRVHRGGGQLPRPGLGDRRRLGPAPRHGDRAREATRGRRRTRRARSTRRRGLVAEIARPCRRSTARP